MLVDHLFQYRISVCEMDNITIKPNHVRYTNFATMILFHKKNVLPKSNSYRRTKQRKRLVATEILSIHES